MRFKLDFPIASILLLSLLSSGCHKELQPGHYEGNLLKRVDQKLVEEPVRIEVSKTADDAMEILISSVQKNELGQKIGTAYVRRLKSHQIQITSSMLGSTPFIANRVEPNTPDKEVRCYASHEFFIVEFCFEKNRFLLEVIGPDDKQFLELSAYAFPVEKPFVLEPPERFTLTGAIERAFARNFESKIAFVRVLQAKQAALAAYLNLFPHLTTNLIWNATPNYITYIATLQGFVPFLLPNYWIDAKIASIDHQMKERALDIMRGNLVATVEELVYSYERDTSVASSYKTYRKELLDLRQHLSSNNNIPDAIKKQLLEFTEYILKAIHSDLADLSKVVRQDRFSFAETLGYRNLEVVDTLTIDQENVPIDQATLVDPNFMADEIVKNRSLELQQLYALKQEAGLRKIENFFIWLDPTGDPKQGLGLNTFPQQKQAEHQIQEIDIEIEQKQTDIYHAAYKLGLEYNEAIQAFYEIKKELDTITIRLNQMIDDALERNTLQLEDLRKQGKAYLAALLAHETGLANYRIARAKKDRFFLSGFYTKLLPRAKRPPAVLP